MNSLFKKHQITDMSLGEILQSKREENKISIEQVAQDLKINRKYLEVLESSEYNKLPQGVYGKNFLREYCLYLKLNCKKMTELYETETELNFETNDEEEIFSHKRAKWRYFLSLPKIMRHIILALVIAGCLVYLGLKVQQIIAPPELIINFPPENYITNENKIEILGVVEGNARVFINDKEVFNNENNSFKEIINLKQGINIIIIMAKKKYGGKQEVRRQVLVK